MLRKGCCQVAAVYRYKGNVMSPYENFATPYPLSSSDGRVHITVYPGCPAYLCVTHDEVSEGEIDEWGNKT
jgi:hypothetical protein